MSIFNRLTEKIHHGTFLMFLLHRLARCGIEIICFDLFKDCIQDNQASASHSEPKQDVARRLNPEDVALCPDVRDSKHSDEKLKHILSNPQEIVVGIVIDRQIAAYMCANLTQCHESLLPFDLTGQEAYIHNIYTFPAFRGRRLAGQLLYYVNHELALLGKTTTYMIINRLNKPSQKFHLRQGGHRHKCFLFIKVFGLFRKRLLLRTYT